MPGPLAGLKIIEMKGIGPGPYAGMLLADLGADVTVVERASRTTGIAVPAAKDVHARGKRSIALDLKRPEAVAALLRLVERADALLEGFRPGVAERLGFGPDVCLQRNPALVYGRLTGWGQTGPLASVPGHDINYIAISGALAAIGDAERPVIPLNLLGDYAGGSLFLVMGLLAALLHARASGEGQVVDAAISDGAANLMSGFYGWRDIGFWNDRRGTNLLDGGAYHYNVYRTADDSFISIGPIEPQFYAEFIRLMALDAGRFGAQQPMTRWPELKAALAERFATRTRAHWCELLEGTDACFAPVLSLAEAPAHRHNAARETFVDIAGVTQPAPAPRFSATPPAMPEAGHAEGADGHAVLRDAGFSDDEIAALEAANALS